MAIDLSEPVAAARRRVDREMGDFARAWAFYRYLVEQLNRPKDSPETVKAEPT